jgi:hypothetical protein
MYSVKSTNISEAHASIFRVKEEGKQEILVKQVASITLVFVYIMVSQHAAQVHKCLNSLFF